MAFAELSPDQLQEIINNPVDTVSGLSDSLRAQVIEAYRQGFRYVFILLAALAAFSFFVAAILLKQKKLDRDDDDALKEQGKAFVEALKEAQSKKNVRQSEIEVAVQERPESEKRVD